MRAVADYRAVWDFGTWNPPNWLQFPNFHSFGNGATASVVHPCESTYSLDRLAYTLDRTACAAPHIPLCRSSASPCLCCGRGLQNSHRASSGYAFSWFVYIPTQNPSTCTQIEAYRDLQPNCIQNYMRMKRFVYTEVLMKNVSSQTCNLQCTWPDV